MRSIALARPRTITSRQRALIRTLLYFDVFGHPLREDELIRFLGHPEAQRTGVHDDLHDLLERGSIASREGFFGVGDLAPAIDRRRDNNRRAEARMAKARRMSRFIGRFPFVRAVMLSGSISKGCMAEDGDIDYFVITEPGRLWIARTLLIAFKKIFLLNSRRDFCVNYFVDTEHLAIEDRNLFTAMEVMTLIPTYDGDRCEAFFRANAWAADLLPNVPRPNTHHLPVGRERFKHLMERVLRNNFGDELDAWCMYRTLKRWRTKFPEFDHASFDLALRTRRYVSKHHPRNFQERVLRSFAERIARFEQGHGISLDQGPWLAY